MNRILANQWLQLALRILVGGVFIWAGVLKIRDPLAFADSIASFELVPTAFISAMALALPVLEVIVGVLLVVGWQRRVASASVLLLCGVFAVALVQALVRGLEVDCGCFGAGEPSVMSTWVSLGRDLLLLVGAGIIYVRELGRAPIEQAQPLTEEDLSGFETHGN